VLKLAPDFKIAVVASSSKNVAAGAGFMVRRARSYVSISLIRPFPDVANAHGLGDEIETVPFDLLSCFKRQIRRRAKRFVQINGLLIQSGLPIAERKVPRVFFKRLIESLGDPFRVSEVVCWCDRSSGRRPPALRWNPISLLLDDAVIS